MPAIGYGVEQTVWVLTNLLLLAIGAGQILSARLSREVLPHITVWFQYATTLATAINLARGVDLHEVNGIYPRFTDRMLRNGVSALLFVRTAC